MRPRLIAILLLLVLIPLGLVAWLAVRVVREGRAAVESRFREVLTGQLEDLAGSVARFVEAKEREILRLTALETYDTASLREVVRRSGLISQVFVLDSQGRLVHPPPAGPLSTSEREFLSRAAAMWEDKQVFYAPAEGRKQVRDRQAARQSLGSAAQGWYTWYWGTGLEFVFWRRDPLGFVVGVELNRARLLADLMAELPYSGPDGPALPEGRIGLTDSRGAELYQWGEYEPGKGERPRATAALPAPFQSWKFEYYLSASGLERGLGRGVLVSVGTGVAAVAAALVALAVYFYRESSREMREARQRVNFVNQVSHELKTPLTNIRMYAELLEQRLEDGDEKAAEHVDVIVSESQRLSRLINNVLTMARHQRGKLALHPTTGAVDDVVRSVLEDFRPLLAAKGVEVEFEGAAGDAVRLDADALVQILGNLFSNVEKYAAAGGWMGVRTEQAADIAAIIVSDRGPGIPARVRERVFEPFWRASDRLTDAAAGTGIGLTIARELARLHGGDLTLERSDAGACFRVTLRCPPLAHRDGATAGEKRKTEGEP